MSYLILDALEFRNKSEVKHIKPFYEQTILISFSPKVASFEFLCGFFMTTFSTSQIGYLNVIYIFMLYVHNVKLRTPIFTCNVHEVICKGLAGKNEPLTYFFISQNL